MTGKEYADKEYSNLDEGLKGIIAKSFDTGKGDIADIKANCDYVLEGKENEYREERSKLIDDFENMKAGLESQIATLGERCNQLLKDKGDLTDQIADIKANCDLAIEGRDIKIKELEQQVKDLEWQLQEVAKDNDYYQAENKKLEKENAELKERLAETNLNGNIVLRELTKAREIIALGLRVCETSSIDYINLYQKQAEQFLEKVK